MDLSVRKNEKCIIGMPRCDYAFNSSRSCFIGYGFKESNFERQILTQILAKHQIEGIDAGTQFRPAQFAFCTKICSKILTSQFCIILANNDSKGKNEIPNANVNMEYGLMLGFNKYVIPFQKEEQRLPFNVAALDTVKYNTHNFYERAETEITKAISIVTEVPQKPDLYNTVIDTFLASRDVHLSPVTDDGEKALYSLGDSMGFNLLNHFDGLKYLYFGNFVGERTEVILYKIQTLDKLLNFRAKSIPARLKLGIVKKNQVRQISELLNNIEIWVMTANESIKNDVSRIIQSLNLGRKYMIISPAEVDKEFNHVVRSLDTLVNPSITGVGRRRAAKT